MPNGWRKTDLSTFISIKHGFAFKSEYFSESGDYILLTPGSFYEVGGYRDQGAKTKYYVGEIPDLYLLSKGELLVAMTEQAAGLLGSTLFVPKSNVYLHNQRLGKIVIEAHEQITKEFLYLTFNAPYARKQISSQSTGTKVKHTSPDKLKSVVCLLPPIDEQRKIAEIISTWDKAISTTECLIDNSKQQKKALMQQLLTGKKRLLDDSGKPFEGEFMRLSMGELANIDKNSLGKKTPNDYEFNYISLSDVETGKISQTLEKHQFSSSPSRARRVISDGDILLATVRPNLQGFAKVKKEHDGMIASTGFSVLTPKKQVSGDYLYHYIFSCHITGQINALVVGSNYPAINSSDVSGLKVYIPSYEEQVKIANVLNNADESLRMLERQLTDLKQEKKALMQQLLTGKRRVKVN
ncbi:restriction endonuclease subunit S [Alteromonas portus]|uniref:restriction endonuclease subunit S n=1 Tax=Alteromonas portus TaxID=2565549 RepID=UPI00196BAA79|nr:restriction endonuclease subunit S [Alteromonas portus]